NFDFGVTQRFGPLAFVAAARLHHRLADFLPAQPRSQLAPALNRACKRTPQRQRANANIHLVFGNIDSRDNEIILCHHPAPFLARSGLEAHATVRVEEDTGPVPRSPTGSQGLRARSGSGPATGGWLRTARSPILADFPDTRARRKPLKPLRAGMPGSSGCTCGDYARVLFHFAREAAGALGARHSPRPRLSGRNHHAHLG